VSIWDWLTGRKPKPRPNTQAELMAEAVEELGRRHARNKKKGWLRKHHIDDRRELVIKPGQEANLEGDLLNLTADTFVHRKLYEPDSKERADLTKAGDVAAAERAAIEAKSVMAKKGIKPSEHYYREGERRAAGEVQATYDVDETGPPEVPPAPKKG
jgi:hypothetical protein